MGRKPNVRIRFASCKQTERLRDDPPKKRMARPACK